MVSLTPAINFLLFVYFWPVSTTPGKNVIAGDNDTGDKLYWWQRSALAAKLSPAAEVGHGRRYCHWNSHENAQRHLTNPDQRPRRPPKYFKPKRHYLVLAASGASDQDVWGVFGCNYSWRFQWHHRRPWPNSAAVADFGGWRYRRFIPFNFLLSTTTARSLPYSATCKYLHTQLELIREAFRRLPIITSLTPSICLWWPYNTEPVP